MAINTGAQETKAVNYWKAYLGVAERCQFPKYDDEAREEGQKSLFLDVEIGCLQELLQRASGDPSFIPAMLRAAWSIVLHCFTGLDHVCFGSGGAGSRAQKWADAAAECLSDAKLASMKMDGGLTLCAIVQKARLDYLDGLAYGAVAANNAEVQSLQASKKNLYNTAIFVWEGFELQSIKNGEGILPYGNSLKSTSKVCNVEDPTTVTNSDMPSRMISSFISALLFNLACVSNGGTLICALSKCEV